MLCALAIVAISVTGCGNDDAGSSQEKSASNLPVNEKLESMRATSPAVASLLAGSGAYADATGWPQAALVKMSQADEEKRYMQDVRCFDSACFNAEAFDKFIVKTYPDVAKARFKPWDTIADDKGLIADARMDFRRGLYFAKRIRLADGSSLFDLLAKCSRTLDRHDAAQFGTLADGKTPYIDLQYFARFRQTDTGEDVDMQILFDRVGDDLRARSPFFSSSIVLTKDFMSVHHLECRNQTEPLIAVLPE